MRGIGSALGMLHHYNYAHKDFYPQHILINLKSRDFCFIDCEKTRYTINLNDFIKELHIFSLLLSLTISNRQLHNLWNNFMKGYQSGEFHYVQQVLSQVHPPHNQSIAKKIWYRFVFALNCWVLKQTGGSWTLLPRFRPHENPKRHVYLMNLWSVS